MGAFDAIASWFAHAAAWLGRLTAAILGGLDSLLRHHPVWGLVAVFAAVALETSLILHFVPAIGVVILAAAVVGTSPWRAVAVVAVCTVAATTGSWTLYLGSRYGGRGFIGRHPRWFGLTPARLERLERTFRAPTGEFMVFAFRLVPVLRALISIPAGLAEMNVARFVALSFLGHAVLNSALVFATYRVCKGVQHATAGAGVAGGLTDPSPTGASGSAGAAGPSCGAALRMEARQWSEPLHDVWVHNWPLATAVTLIVALAAWWMWRHRRRIAAEYDHVLVQTWERTAVASAAAGLLLAVVALVFPRTVAGSATFIATRVVSAWNAERNPALYVFLLAGQLLAIGLILAALRYVLAGPVKGWRARLRERRTARLKSKGNDPPSGP